MTTEKTSMQSKHEIERTFHDHKATSDYGSDPHNFYSAGGLNMMWRSYLTAVGDLHGKHILDFGCGEGWSSVEYAKRGAIVHSFDLSPESVRNLMQQAKRDGIAERIHPAVMAAECLAYPDNTFDLVLGVAILHHTDPISAGTEVSRVLKPGGRALFIEPLSHNIFLKLFRWLTPNRRTPTEQPMSVRQISEFGRFFNRAGYRGCYFLSIFPQGLLWATGNRSLFRWSLGATELVDGWLLKSFAFLNRYCWSSIIEVEK